jgi:hypothetical protein
MGIRIPSFAWLAWEAVLSSPVVDAVVTAVADQRGDAVTRVGRDLAGPAAD